MFCPKCGTQLPDGAQFCGNCGNSLQAQVQAAPAVAPAAPPVAASGPQAAAAVPVAAAPRKRTPLIVGIGALVVIALAGFAVYQLFFAPYSINESTFPDQSVRVALMQQDLDGDGKISRDQAKTIQALNLSQSGVASLEGLQHLSNLQELDLSGCRALVEADFSKVSSVAKLNVSGSGLASMDISMLGNLQELNAKGTSIAALDISHNAKLAKLKVEDEVAVTGTESTAMREQWVVSGYTSEGFSGIYQGFGGGGDGGIDKVEASFAYDDLGRLSQRKTATTSSYSSDVYTNTIDYSYSDDGKTVTEMPQGQSSDTVHVFNDAGQRVERTTTYYKDNGGIDSTSTIVYAYDDAGRLTSQTSKYSSGETVRSYVYNDSGQIIEINSKWDNDSLNVSNLLSYNEDGTLSSVEVPDMGLVTFDYNELGQCITANRFYIYNGEQNDSGAESYEYDAEGRLVSARYDYVRNDNNSSYESHTQGDIRFLPNGFVEGRDVNSSWVSGNDSNSNSGTLEMRYTRIFTPKEAADLPMLAGISNPICTISYEDPFNTAEFLQDQPEVVRTYARNCGVYSF